MQILQFGCVRFGQIRLRSTGKIVREIVQRRHADSQRCLKKGFDNRNASHCKDQPDSWAKCVDSWSLLCIEVKVKKSRLWLQTRLIRLYLLEIFSVNPFWIGSGFPTSYFDSIFRNFERTIQKWFQFSVKRWIVSVEIRNRKQLIVWCGCFRDRYCTFWSNLCSTD